MTIRPTRGNILVKLKAKQEKTDGGIILPDTVRSQYIQATVISVSEGTVTVNGTVLAHEVLPGDVILVSLPDPKTREVDIGNEKYHLVRDTDIVAII